jgi:hypothetical protein
MKTIVKAVVIIALFPFVLCIGIYGCTYVHVVALSHGAELPPWQRPQPLNLCMPGSTCCAFVGSAGRRCGTLEQFQRYATGICLQERARQDRTFNPMTVGDCYAARIAVESVAWEQQNNGKLHADAKAARRELDAFCADPRNRQLGAYMTHR